ncbi:MAG: PQQ-dependent sugar dehydrogenase [Zymomonas mobilis subsp. pomaceae]|nr:PQQ-dependent sugar dehydrogenase [Zymomonas mobilis]MDX5948927.1 PQQ-dependent sugar dehydrogenase [Zymomonas mobilis subsp. pomaceae]
MIKHPKAPLFNRSFGQRIRGKAVFTWGSVFLSAFLLSGCNVIKKYHKAIDAELAAKSDESGESVSVLQGQLTPVDRRPFIVHELAKFAHPTAMSFLPDGRLLVTEKSGEIKLWHPDNQIGIIRNLPAVSDAGQGGLLDIALHPDFDRNHLIYLSWTETSTVGKNKNSQLSAEIPAENNGNESFDKTIVGAVVGRAELIFDNKGGGRLSGLSVIWRQDPKTEGNLEFGARMVFAPDKSLFISSGDRHQPASAQDMSINLGKIVRITDIGRIPPDNPFNGTSFLKSQIWTSGHRNPLGLAFSPDGLFWENEIGQNGGDELNLIRKGANYGWPIVSEQATAASNTPTTESNVTHQEFVGPKWSWSTSLAPSSLAFYTGNLFPEWKGNAFIGGLASQMLVRMEIKGEKVRETDRWPMGHSVRDVTQGPDGALWLICDDPNGGILIRLAPPGR